MALVKLLGAVAALYCCDCFGAGIDTGAISAEKKPLSSVMSASAGYVVDARSIVSGNKLHFICVNGRVMNDSELWNLMDIESRVYLLKVGHELLPKSRQEEVLDFLAGDIFEHRFESYFDYVRSWLVDKKKKYEPNARRNYSALKSFFGGGK
jgi:hypothetical protein